MIPRICLSTWPRFASVLSFAVCLALNVPPGFAAMHWVEGESASVKQVYPNAGLDEVDPEIRETFEKLGIPLEEQKALAGVAVDASGSAYVIGKTYSRD